MNKPYWCDRTLIHNPYIFGVALSEAAFHKALRQMKMPRETWPDWIGSPQSDATLHHFENSDGRLCAIMCLREQEGKTGIQIAALIVHESVHLWQAVRENLGEGKPSSEFEAYSVQSIAQGFMDAYMRARGLG